MIPRGFEPRTSGFLSLLKVFSFSANPCGLVSYKTGAITRLSYGITYAKVKREILLKFCDN